jgi:two-component system NtrC family response regulator
MTSKNILLIDDEEGLRKLLGRIIRLEGYAVEEASTLKAAQDLLKRKAFEIVLCDVKLPDGNGVDFVKEIKLKQPSAEVILLTAYGNIPDGVQAIKNGAFDYLTKGNDNDRIIPLLAQAMGKVAAQKVQAVKISSETSTSFSSIIGRSRVMKETVSLAQKIAPTSSTVLLLGETGTGKEVFANAIHNGSSRREGSFVAINCSAFTKDLLEGELFGHKAGAYTGATKDKKGLIETADGGTLFLDEIGELNLDLQAKLLRVLESGEFIKLGDTKLTKVFVRVIAATNRDLQREVSEGHFREDLFYRLNTFTISLPPLRERKEDIAELATYFLQTFAQREGKSISGLSADALQTMEVHSWRGNIRELRNVMERAVILSNGPVIGLADLPVDIQHQHSTSSGMSLAQVEKTHIQKMLLYTGGNKTKAAQLLEIGLATLYRKLDDYNLPK